MTEGTQDLVAPVAARLRAAKIGLRAGEIADWDREAALLVASASADDPARGLDRLVADRVRGVPLGYLTGAETFLGDDFAVEPGVIIPHPATELLALLAVRAVDLYAGGEARPGLLEVGVGSGAVAVSVLKRRPAVEAHGSELSAAALRLTRDNAARLVPAPYTLKLYQCYFTDELFAPFTADPPRNVQVVVSNPPYLADTDQLSEATRKSGLAHLSYSPDNDPSWFLRQVTADPEGYLAPSCSIVMECAEWYFTDHEKVLTEAGWQVELFDRQKYVSVFGASPDMRPMRPSGHRVLHAWRGEGRPLA
ncbi:hypothetical protein Skr01_54070 [Sphaerisporangium krabiense]|uniref:Release factor glutamine methyltransferase n=1 Tax=Sphaerisporangium krabiense TaxID=763782 RepID=A0A7W8Z4N3_9ACTN|nr:methyltransferase [Sphaerisporangium krabiense]MBB5627165.1 release factor glutamine methyltransferase [Sphaerisporangium krabiense]GII65322.1 hypothetical protein Skr01_54070 [Sphaerisporangium krabiense]